MATYSYGENAETHYSIVVFFKRLLTYYEVYSNTRGGVEKNVWEQLSEDSVIHPRIQKAIKEGINEFSEEESLQGRTFSEALLNHLVKEENLLPPFCQSILTVTYDSEVASRLRTLLSVAAFEEDRERLAQSQVGVDSGNIHWGTLS